MDRERNYPLKIGAESHGRRPSILKGLDHPGLLGNELLGGPPTRKPIHPDSMDLLRGLMQEETPTMPSASGVFDNSPQFQLRVRNPDAQFVPTGRLKFVVVRALARVKSHWFSRPCGTANRKPPR